MVTAVIEHLLGRVFASRMARTAPMECPTTIEAGVITASMTSSACVGALGIRGATISPKRESSGRTPSQSAGARPRPQADDAGI